MLLTKVEGTEMGYIMNSEYYSKAQERIQTIKIQEQVNGI